MIGLAATTRLLYGQGMYSEFGRSPYRHLDRTWFSVEKGLFRVYYHQGGQRLAEWLVEAAPHHLKDLQDSFDYHFRAPVSIVLFTSYNEWLSSNFPLELNRPPEYGHIPIRVNHLTVFFTGNHYELIEQLRDGLSDVILADLFFGGTLQERIQNAFLLTIPDWALSGFEKVYAWEWDARFDDWLRHAVTSRRLRWFNQLEEYERPRYAMAFWRYVRDRYGMQAVRSILFTAQMQKNLETALYAVLGKSLGQLHREFYRHYRDRAAGSEADVGEGWPLPLRRKRWEVLQSRFSNDGRWVAVLLHHDGRYRLMVGDRSKRSWTEIRKEGVLQNFAYADAAYFSFAFQPDAPILWVCYPGRHGYHLAPYELERGRWGDDRLLTFIEKPLSFDVGAGAQAMVFSAIRRGQSDIFYYRFRANRFIPVTSDPYDDLWPVFGARPDEVFFSSNRPSDTLWLRYPRGRQPRFFPTLQLFRAVVDKKAAVKGRKWHRAHYYRAPASWEVTHPRVQRNGTVAALADHGGVSHVMHFEADSIYQYSEVVVRYADSARSVDTFYFLHPDSVRLDSVWFGGRPVAGADTVHVYYDTARVVRRFSFGGYAYGWHLAPGGGIQYVVRRHGRYWVGAAGSGVGHSGLALNAKAFWADRMRRFQAPFTFRHKGRPLERLLRRLGKEYGAPTPSPPPEEPPFRWVPPYPPPPPGESPFPLSSPPDSAAPPRFRHSPYELTFLPRFIRLQLDNSLIASYYFPYIPNQPFYYVPRANALTLVRLQDIFRNHAIEVGFRTNFNFSGGDYWLRYIDRRKRWLHDVMFYRTTLTQANAVGYYYQQVTEMVSYRASWPLSPVLFVRLTPSVRHDKFHFLSMDLVSLTTPPLNSYRLGLKAELVAQNLLPLEFNLYRGYRGKVYYETFLEAAFSGGRRLSATPQVHVVGMDLRHYVPLRRPIVWAQRFSMGTSMGRKKIVYYLGGEENWFFPKFNADLPVDAENEYIYQALVAPLRGFPQNIRNGTRYLLLNNELRVSLFHLIHGKPIHSAFLEKFQVVFFGDVGTAWYRGSPFSKEAAVRKHRIQSGPFDITVETTSFPMVAGAGVGLRLEAMGYYWRIDYGWGYELGNPVNRQFYLAVGSDF